MTDLLSGQTAVVTGASSGNGRSIARTFAAHGADVVIADLQEEPREDGRPTHELINDETDSTAVFSRCDVTNNGDLQQAIDAAAEFGGVDIMVNNAGVYWEEEFTETTEAEYEKMMAVNVKGVFFGAQFAAKHMLENGGGIIINMSSIGGIAGSTVSASYSASKGAVRLLTYSLAADLGPDNIRVNAIHPGLIDTQLSKEDVEIITEENDDYADPIPLKRAGQPQEVANIALFLASDLSSYVNGESIVVDGGRTNSV